MNRPFRYIVEFSDHIVSYNCSLGNKVALAYAIQTASRYWGRIKVEMIDGTFEDCKEDTRKARKSYENPV